MSRGRKAIAKKAARDGEFKSLGVDASLNAPKRWA